MTVTVMAALLAGCDRSRSGRGIAAVDARLQREAPIRSYRIEYEVRELDQRQTETVVVRRPYDSKTTVVRDGTLVSGAVTNEAGSFQYVGSSGSWELVDPGRRRAQSDPRPLGSLAFLVQKHAALLQGRDVAVGRPCTMVRTRTAIGISVRDVPTTADHDDLCIDVTGVLLREDWVIGGRSVRQKEATHFEPEISLSASEFRPEPVQTRGGTPEPSRVLVPVTSAIEAGLVVDFSLPAGVASDGADAWLSRDASGGPTGTIVRFYVRGVDLVDVEEQPSDTGGHPSGEGVAAGVGHGYLAADLGTAKLSVVLPNGVTVVMQSGSVELLRAMALAMRLRRP